MRKCPECGARILADSRYCSYRGAKLVYTNDDAASAADSIYENKKSVYQKRGFNNGIRAKLVSVILLAILNILLIILFLIILSRI